VSELGVLISSVFFCQVQELGGVGSRVGSIRLIISTAIVFAAEIPPQPKHQIRFVFAFVKFGALLHGL
jgi:hypothetical protein